MTIHGRSPPHLRQRRADRETGDQLLFGGELGTRRHPLREVEANNERNHHSCLWQLQRRSFYVTFLRKWRRLIWEGLPRFLYSQ